MRKHCQPQPVGGTISPQDWACLCYDITMAPECTSPWDTTWVCGVFNLDNRDTSLWTHTSISMMAWVSQKSRPSLWYWQLYHTLILSTQFPRKLEEERRWSLLMHPVHLHVRVKQYKCEQNGREGNHPNEDLNPNSHCLEKWKTLCMATACVAPFPFNLWELRCYYNNYCQEL